MSDLTAGMVTEVTAASLRPILFFEGEFDSGFVRLWTGYGSLEWDAKTWNGSGTLLAVSAVQNTADIRAAGVTVDLSGISSEVIALALAEAQQGKEGTIWLGMLAADGTVVADPVILFRGKLDVPAIEDGGETCRVAISYESRLIDLERPRARRYTPEDQATDYPDDKGFNEVAKLQDVKVVWGFPVK